MLSHLVITHCTSERQTTLQLLNNDLLRQHPTSRAFLLQSLLARFWRSRERLYDFIKHVLHVARIQFRTQV